MDMNSFYESLFANDQMLRNVEGQETGMQPPEQPQQEPVPVPPGYGTPSARQIRIQQPAYPLGQTVTDTNIYIYPQNLRDALQLIVSALNRETEDKYTYDFLLKAAPAEDLPMLNQFHNDELNHYKLLRQIYTDLTGQAPPQPSPLSRAIKKRGSYCEALEIGIKEIGQELQEYARILYAMQNRTHINMMLNIIINEIRHSSGVNFMYAKSCGKRE
jgi:rubrerythrin